MRVAGFGCRSGVSVAEARAALDAALARWPGPLDALAVPEGRAGEPALRAVEGALPLHAVPRAALEAVAGRALTASARSLAATGAPSAAECAALAIAGPDARLLGPRIVVGPVTCAIAQSGESSP